MYNLAHQMAQMPQNLGARYKAGWSQWTSLQAPANTYGNTSALVNALNYGALTNAQQGYNSAYVQTQSYPSGNYSSLDYRTQATVANQYATSELAQTTTTNTLATLGTIRTNEQQLATKLSNLDSDTFSTDSSLQTQNALLGKINSATLLQIHSQQDTNQLLGASIQQQLVAQKQQIDAQNRSLSNPIYFQQNFPTSMQNVNNGVSDPCTPSRSVSMGATDGTEHHRAARTSYHPTAVFAGQHASGQGIRYLPWPGHNPHRLVWHQGRPVRFAGTRRLPLRQVCRSLLKISLGLGMLTYYSTDSRHKLQLQ